MRRLYAVMAVVILLSVASAVLADGWEDVIKVNGYFQNRYVHYSEADDQFTLRRMYINLIATPNDRTMAVVTWARIGPSPYDANWANVFGQYKLSDTTTIRFGQAPNWFGLETQQSSSQRMALERAAVLEGGGAAPPGLYWQGPWDRGAWLIHTPQDMSRAPQVILGVMNGQFREPEADGNKTVSVDLKMKPAWGQYGVSWLNGKWTDGGGVSTDRRAWLGYLRYDQPANWAFQGAYVHGSLLGSDTMGWYGQVEYGLSPVGTLFAKFEEYDPDDSSAGNTYSAWHFGYAHQVDANNELTCQWTDAESGGSGFNEAGVQWQYAIP